MKRKNNHYYLTFSETMDVAAIPVRALSKTGTWARRSSFIYEGTTELTKKELETFLLHDCGVRRSLFRVLKEEDAIYLEN